MGEQLLHIELLGGFRIARPGGAAVEIPCRQAASVLAYLALHPRRTHAREELADLFWPDDDSDEGRAKLRKALTAIRDWFVEAGVDPDSVLRAGRAEVSLDPSAVCTDVREIEESVAAAARSKESADRALFLTHAVNRYRGELLPGFYEECLSAERHRLSVVYEAALHDLVGACEQNGELDRGLDIALRGIARNRTDEDAHCAAMRIFAAKGQPGAVVRQFNELERALRSELGACPSESARQLMMSLTRAGESTREAREVAVPSPSRSPGSYDWSAGEANAERRHARSGPAQMLAWALVLILGVALALVLLGARGRQEPPRGRPTFDPRTVKVGSYPVALACDGTCVWVTNRRSRSVTKFRANDGTVVATYRTGKWPVGIAFDGKVMWIANRDENTLSRIRVRDGVDLGKLTLKGTSPQGLVFDGESIWVVEGGSSQVEKIRAADGLSLLTAPAGKGALYAAFDGANLWVTDMTSDTVTEIRATDGTVVRTVAAGHFPHGIAFDGSHLWVADYHGHCVRVIRARDGVTEAELAAGSKPFSTAFDGTYVWVSDHGGASATKFRVRDRARISVHPTGPAPLFMLSEGAHIWCVSQDDDSVRRL